MSEWFVPGLQGQRISFCQYAAYVKPFQKLLLCRCSFECSICWTENVLSWNCTDIETHQVSAMVLVTLPKFWNKNAQKVRDDYFVRVGVASKHCKWPIGKYAFEWDVENEGEVYVLEPFEIGQDSAPFPGLFMWHKMNGHTQFIFLLTTSLLRGTPTPSRTSIIYHGKGRKWWSLSKMHSWSFCSRVKWINNASQAAQNCGQHGSFSERPRFSVDLLLALSMRAAVKFCLQSFSVICNHIFTQYWSRPDIARR